MVHDEHMIQRPFAVITAASDGLGNELARLFASKGFDLLITDRFDVIHEVKLELLKYGGIVEAHALDLGTFAGVEKLHQAIRTFGHPVDALVLHAEEGPHGPFLDTELKDEFACIRENVLSPVHLMKRVLKEMVERGHGKILVTSSLGPPAEAPFEAVYSAAKAFLFSLTESVRTEVRNEGVTLTTLLPNLYDMPSEEDMHMIEVPEDLARECFDALMAGRNYVIQASLRSKLQSMVTRLLPDKARAFITPTPS